MRSFFSSRRFLILTWLIMMMAQPESLHAARIADIGEVNAWEQAARFFSLKDPSVRYTLVGSLLLGLCCGILGSFVVVRKMALVGDALSHAVLPGVALGFLWNLSKDPVAIFIGATLAGLLGTAVVNWIQQTTRLKEDTALGMVLAGFFSVGICLLTMIQRLPSGNKSGIDKFLFGQAAALGPADVQLMAVVAAVSMILLAVCYKEFLVTSFDPGFARALGFPVQLFHHALMLMLAFAVVVSLQAVGVVLVSAMLITPAATAYLLTERMHRMLWLSGIIGAVTGVVGAFCSFLGPGLPTGPFMVLAASLLFTGAFLFAPRHGVVLRAWLRRSREHKVRYENTLKSIFHVLEDRHFSGEGVSLRELAERRKETLEEALLRAKELRSQGLATLSEDRDCLFLTPAGWEKATSIVRNHRLWELYLTNQAQYAADHVHDDAEKIEHLLGEDVVRELERKLEYATHDPHGKLIPNLSDIQRNAARLANERLTGYGKRP
jgi:manganese/zinc/iron transport system permease protein